MNEEIHLIIKKFRQLEHQIPIEEISRREMKTPEKDYYKVLGYIFRKEQ